jgi:hypothetical protein
VESSQKPMKLNLQYTKIIQDVKKVEKGINLTIELQWGAQINCTS